MTGEAEGERMPPRVLMGVVVFALVVRVLHLLQAGSAPEFGIPWLDQRFYHDQAAALAAGSGVVFSGFRSMLYPWLISLVYRITGPDPVAVVWLQSLLGCATAGICALAAWRLTRKASAALAAGWLLSLNPVAPVFECGLLTASPSLLVMAVFTLALVRALAPDAAPRWLVVAGAMPALLLHLTPQLAPVLLAPLLFAPGRWPARGRILAGFAATLVLLSGLHAATTGRWFVAGGSGGINAWLGNHAKADGIFPKQTRAVSYQGGYQDPIELLAVEEARRITGDAGLPPGKVSGFWWAETAREIRAAPGRWTGLMLRKAWAGLWNAEPPNVMNPGFWRRHAAPWTAWLPAGWGLLLLLLPAGLWRADRRARAVAAAWGLGLAGLCLFFVNSRYRLPLLAPLTVLAGTGLANLRALAAARTWRPFAVSAVLGLASFVNWGGIAPFPEHPDWMARGEAWLTRGRPEEAVASYQRAVGLAPADIGGWFGLGNAFFACEKWREAVAAYDRGLALDPDHALIHHNRARALDLAGDAVPARAGYLRALRLNPGNALAAGQFAMFLIRRGEPEEARALLTRPRQEGQGPAPQEEIAWAWILESGGRAAEAAAIRERLRTQWPGQIEVLLQELPPVPPTR